MTETNNQSIRGLDDGKRVIHWILLMNKVLIDDQN